jgi:hypothetical protein
LKALRKKLFNQVRGFLSNELSKMDVNPIQFSETTQSILEKLRQDQHRRGLLLGPESDLNKLLSIHLGKDFIIGAGTIFSGVVGMIDPELMVTLCVAALKDLIGPELGQQAAAAITEYLVQEIGENAFLELVEIVGAAATGVGLFFVAYKIIRYSLLFKRLFIDQEPLEKMRATIQANAIQALRMTAEKLYNDLSSQIEKVLGDVEVKLKSIALESSKQRDLSFVRLKGSLRAAAAAAGR